MASIKEQYKNVDIAMDNGLTATAGSSLHRVIVNMMTKEAEAKQQEKVDGYTASLKSHVDQIEGLSDDSIVEAFVLVKNGDGFEVTAVDNAKKIVVKKYLRKATKEE